MHFARIGVALSSGLAAALALGAGCSSSSGGAATGNTDGGGEDGTSSGSSSGSTSSSSSGSSSSSSSSSGSSSSSSSSGSSSGVSDASSDAETGAGDSGCSGATPVALTVKNYRTWCSVSVAGMASSPAASQTVCVASGATVSLSASALTGFILGPAPWHDTSGDHDAGDPGTFVDAGAASTSSTTITVSGSSACVWVCCPFPSGTGCNAANQCP